MKKILIVIPYYFPGYRAGGPQQTIKNIVEAFGNDAEFHIYTQNHDLNIDKPYGGIKNNCWTKFGNAKVMYVSSDEYCGSRLRELYSEFDIIYLCGLFERSSIVTLLIHRCAKKKKKLYMAPMGVFSDGAMCIKKFKKQLFITIFQTLGCFKNIIWSFSSSIEVSDAERHLKRESIKDFILAEDLPRKIDYLDCLEIKKQNVKQANDKLRVIFLSRICNKKNLSYCFDILSTIKDYGIIFDIYGTKEDLKYWNVCHSKMAGLPKNIEARYCGEVQSQNVIKKFSEYDIFLFPTKGENFGHVIYEALAAGCIPIISDTTPWNDFDENKCGNVIAIDDKDKFSSSLEEYCRMDSKQLFEYSENAIKYAVNRYETSKRSSGYKVLWK